MAAGWQWERAASEGLGRLRARDADGVNPLVKAINALARNPEPAAGGKLGNTNLRRLRVGIYRVTYERATYERATYERVTYERVTYEIDGGAVAIKILMVGGTAA
ncbi:type II toxin-antitoxin system RelE/ParE family toxin [Streptomyces sp. NPDC097610]|uniref:type II toxin-antitoxin system RelE family toxin n=1 Tax=Streptomyces sp. NPDC097610 TaxID=3157227 RepID=UPI0033313A79